MLSAVIRVVTGHVIMGVHARRIGVDHLSNDFCRNCRDQKVLHLLGTSPPLRRRRKRHFGACYINDVIGVPLRTCKLKIDDEISASSNSRRTGSYKDRVALDLATTE